MVRRLTPTNWAAFMMETACRSNMPSSGLIG
jgi:hypothetical protein